MKILLVFSIAFFFLVACWGLILSISIHRWFRRRSKEFSAHCAKIKAEWAELHNAASYFWVPFSKDDLGWFERARLKIGVDTLEEVARKGVILYIYAIDLYSSGGELFRGWKSRPGSATPISKDFMRAVNLDKVKKDLKS